MGIGHELLASHLQEANPPGWGENVRAQQKYACVGNVPTLL